MRLIAISEHYYPRVGGTVNSVHETLVALAARGIEAELWVPGPAPQPDPALPYRVRWIDAGYPPTGEPDRATRYRFCQAVNAQAARLASGADRPDVLHVLFGLFVMEMLETAPLRAAGIRTLATVHNVPPMECRQVMTTAPPAARLREALRLRAVGWKNTARLRRHRYDAYVVPSAQVAGLLDPITGQTAQVIGHGLTSDLQAAMRPPARRRPDPGQPLRILTVGGYAPHKRQHLIPAVADRVRTAGCDVVWDMVGPATRIAGYDAAISAEIDRRGLSGRVRLHKAVPFAALARFYDAAHLYVQPSTEEGFCLTALDAAAAGLPVIASPAGALAEIACASGGRVVASQADALGDAIADFSAAPRWPDPVARAEAVRARFSWARAAGSLCGLYAPESGA